MKYRPPPNPEEDPECFRGPDHEDDEKWDSRLDKWWNEQDKDEFPLGETEQ